MTNTKDTPIKLEDTETNMTDNLELLCKKTKKLEQCLLSTMTLIENEINPNKLKEVMEDVIDQAGDVDFYAKITATQNMNINIIRLAEEK